MIKPIKLYRPEQFRFHRDNTATCSVGKTLTSTGTIYTHPSGARVRQFWARAQDCQSCAQRQRCLKNPASGKGRSASQFGRALVDDDDPSQRMRTAIDSPQGRRLYSQRIATVEPVFANIHHHKRMSRFTLRNRAKVSTQWHLYCLVHSIEKSATKVMRAGQGSLAMLDPGAARAALTDNAGRGSIRPRKRTATAVWLTCQSTLAARRNVAPKRGLFRSLVSLHKAQIEDSTMFVPTWILLVALLLVVALAAWTWLLASGRNPLPFPDRGSRIFSAASPNAKDAIVTLLAQHGVNERFRADSPDVKRSIMWDATIINAPTEAVVGKLGGASSSIGLVSADPAESANRAADFLRSLGFDADVVLDVEPELPIAFVVTNAMPGTVLNFRKHLMHFPKPHSVPRE